MLEAFTSPPPNMALPSPMVGPPPNMSLPPPNLSMPPPNMGGQHFNRFTGSSPSAAVPSGTPRQQQHFFTPFRPYPRPGLDPEFDGKRLRKSVMRKTVDYNASIIKLLESRVWQRDFRDRRALQPDVLYYPDLQPPRSYEDNPMNAVTTRFVKTATNKMRCPVFCMAWTPEGRRLVTGASSGEFTLWNGLTFNFETILQAHDSPVRTMVWSHNEQWMVTADHAGYVKYWQSNMNNVKMFQGHKEAVRGISFSPSDSKFATCSDDGTIRVWDFLRCHEERILRGHGADVKCVDWHPQKGLIVSGSKDNQQPVKLWDPKSGQALATLHAHKSTVMDVKWNSNGNWLVTASRDHLLKLFDIRQLNQELQTFRGHKKESSSVAWHPYHEGLFASGGSDGAILFWHVGADKEVGAIEQAHDSIVWTLAWHPLGHILCSGSNDHTSKFWTRNRPGDQMRDKYNLNNMPAGISGLEEMEQDDSSIIPGMGPEDRIESSHDIPELSISTTSQEGTIPGLDFDVEDKNKPLSKKGIPGGLRWNASFNYVRRPKVPYSKPIPRNFQAQWNDTARPNLDDENGDDEYNGENRDADQDAIAKMIQQIVEKVPGVVPINELEPSALFLYGKVLPVAPDSVLARAINNGSEAIYRLINCGAIEDLSNDIAHDENTPYYHEDPQVDSELRSLKAYELPRRPPLLSTPNIPPQRLPERGRGRGRGRDRGRGRGREDDDDYHRSHDETGDDYDDQEEDGFYDDYDYDDSEILHQRFMGEEEEMYNSLADQESNHGYDDQDFPDHPPLREFSDQDMRKTDQDLRPPAPSLLGVAPGIPGTGAVLAHAPSGPMFMKDQDLRRQPFPSSERDPRQMHSSPHSMGDQDMRSSEDRDFRRQPSHSLRHGPSLLGIPKFSGQGHFSPGQDGDFRMPQAGPDEENRFPTRRGSFRGKEDYEDGDGPGHEDEPQFPRGGHSSNRMGPNRWGQPEESEEEPREYEDSGMKQQWPRGRGAPSFHSRGGRGHRGGPGGPWESKRGRGLLETPRGGLLATPVMEAAEDEDMHYHGNKRPRWKQGQWDEDNGAPDGEPGAEEVEESHHRSSYRGRGSWGPRGSWGGGGGGGGGGPMRGRGWSGRPPRGGRRPRGRN